MLWAMKGVVLTRRARLRRLRDALKRRKSTADAPRTRVVDAMWRRSNQVVHPEEDLSQWVHTVAERDWDSVVKGTNKK